MRALTLLALGFIAWVSYSVTSSKRRPSAAAASAAAHADDETARRHSPEKGNGGRAQHAAPTHLTVRWCVRVPENTPVDSSIYVSGSHPDLGAWSPQGLPLLAESPCVYCGELAVAAGTVFEYKFTRGSWAAVEAAQGGAPRPNRTLAVLAPAVVHAEIEAWADRL